MSSTLAPGKLGFQASAEPSRSGSHWWDWRSTRECGSPPGRPGDGPLPRRRGRPGRRHLQLRRIRHAGSCPAVDASKCRRLHFGNGGGGSALVGGRLPEVDEACQVRNQAVTSGADDDHRSCADRLIGTRRRVAVQRQSSRAADEDDHRPHGAIDQCPGQPSPRHGPRSCRAGPTSTWCSAAQAASPHNRRNRSISGGSSRSRAAARPAGSGDSSFVGRSLATRRPVPTLLLTALSRAAGSAHGSSIDEQRRWDLLVDECVERRCGSARTSASVAVTSSSATPASELESTTLEPPHVSHANQSLPRSRIARKVVGGQLGSDQRELGVQFVSAVALGRSTAIAISARNDAGARRGSRSRSG